MGDSKVGQGKYKTRLECLAVPGSKALPQTQTKPHNRVCLKDTGANVEGALVAKVE